MGKSLSLVGLLLCVASVSCVQENAFDQAKEVLGANAECTWRTGGANREVICYVAGKRFMCVKKQCALIAETPAEEH